MIFLNVLHFLDFLGVKDFMIFLDFIDFMNFQSFLLFLNCLNFANVKILEYMHPYPKNFIEHVVKTMWTPTEIQYKFAFKVGSVLGPQRGMNIWVCPSSLLWFSSIGNIIFKKFPLLEVSFTGSILPRKFPYWKFPSQEVSFWGTFL
jgi:hypothetical protein